MSLSVNLLALAARAYPAARAGRLLTLIYHRVHPAPDPMFPGEVDAARFDWQMGLLRKYCTPLSLADGVQRLKTGHLPPLAVAVTFDDGYADNLTIACPILRKHGIAATFYIAAGYLDGGRMWNDSVIESVRRASGPSLDLSWLGLGQVPLGAEPSRGAIAEKILGAIKHRAPDERARLVAALCAQIGADLPGDLMMTSAQLRELSAAGMEIGAHTMTHPILKTLSAADARREISDSRDALAKIVGRPVRTFAYPNGRPDDDYTLRDRDLVRELGFEFSPSTIWGVAGARTDLFQLPRFTPWDRTPARWLARLLMMYGRPT